MGNYFIVQSDNKVVYEGPDIAVAVSTLPEEPSNIRPTSCTYLIEGKFSFTDIDFVRMVHIKSAYKSRIIPNHPGGSEQREIPTELLERLIDGWRSTRKK